MRQFWAWVWIALTSILALVIIIWIVKWVLSKTNIWKDKISFSWKERIKRRQIKKELEEKKETIINPNTEDESTNEEFQEVIETAVAEKNEEEKANTENNDSKQDSKEAAKEEAKEVNSEKVCGSTYKEFIMNKIYTNWHEKVVLTLLNKTGNFLCWKYFIYT